MIGPDRDADLISAEESNCGTDAMYGWEIAEPLLEVTSQRLLNVTTDTNDNVARTLFFNQGEKNFIFNIFLIDGAM